MYQEDLELEKGLNLSQNIRADDMVVDPPKLSVRSMSSQLTRGPSAEIDPEMVYP